MTAERPTTAIDQQRKPQPFAIKVFWTLITLTLFAPALCIVVMILSIAVALRSESVYEDARASRADSRAYAALETGIDIAEVEQVFDRPPDYSCGFKSYRVHYFFDSARSANEQQPSLKNKVLFPNTVSSTKDLPYAFSSKQILVDSEGVVVAYTWMGEESNIHTSISDYSGSWINGLPDEFFEMLNNQDE